MGGDGGDGERSKLGPLADQYLDRDISTETGQALSFIPHRAAPASRWQAASDWREGVGGTQGP